MRGGSGAIKPLHELCGEVQEIHTDQSKSVQKYLYKLQNTREKHVQDNKTTTNQHIQQFGKRRTTRQRILFQHITRSDSTLLYG